MCIPSNPPVPAGFRVSCLQDWLLGKVQPSQSFNSVEDSQINSFLRGAGVGLDPYRFHSIPVFADLRYNFGRMKTGFLYAHTGYNFTYNHKESEMWIWGNKTTDKSEGGFYLDAGIGYRLHLKGWHRLLFSAGFSHKRINNLIGYTYPCLFPPCPEDIYRNQYNLGRIIAKFSWEFTSPRTQARP